MSTDDFAERGIDYDLKAAIEYNENPFTVEDIEKVFAVYEGENDGPSWHWVLGLKDKRLFYLVGGCDYTGWDCQSWLSAEEIQDFSVIGGLVDNDGVHSVLLPQLEGIKLETWRERTDKLIGDVDIIDLDGAL